MAEGYYEVSYEDGDEYKGEWNTEGMKHGLGKLILSDGTKYSGQFHNGLFHGLGVLKLSDGSQYEGDFLKGMFHGYGIFKRADEMKYEGQFEEGKAFGYGLVTFADGNCGRPRNEGRFENHKCVKRGKATDSIKKAGYAANNARAYIN